MFVVVIQSPEIKLLYRVNFVDISSKQRKIAQKRNSKRFIDRDSYEIRGLLKRFKK